MAGEDSNEAPLIPKSAIRSNEDAESGLLSVEYAANEQEFDNSVLEKRHSRISTKNVPETSTLKESLKIIFYFGLWYALNIAYNIYNKNALKQIPLYWTAATVQLAVGTVYCAVIWGTGIRKAPRLSWGDLRTLTPIAFFNMCGHVGAVVSLGAGAVSFTHIVKSAEPVFTSLLSSVVLGQIFKWPVYVSLIPIISGVAIASMTELDFSWVSFIAAMVSNISCALRAILSKIKMSTPVGRNMDAANLFGVLNAMSFIMLLPIWAAVESWKVHEIYMDNFDTEEEHKFWVEILISGFAYYLYNEVAFLALEQVHPITHAVGNTFKRVIIIVVTVIVFGNTITTLGGIGCTIAILGTLLYSLAKQKFS